ncbi:MAG: RNA polymerase sigma factor RpoD/SigA [Chitinispirillaceae bacterium]|nr:RNA polymerase sigma factor RpoD/SigA [Chitinispirillaceae bacterium]
MFLDKNVIVPDEAALHYYLKEISKSDRSLTSEEEAILAAAIKKGDRKALNSLVKANLRFVVSVARRYQNQGLPLSELISEGNIGLIKAAKRFDEKKNFKFISYAVWWIRQSILRALADRSRITRIPLHRIGVIHKVRNVQNRLEQKYHRLPSAEEIASEAQIGKKEVLAVQKIGNRAVSLYAPAKDDEGSDMIDLIHDENQEMPDTNLIELSREEGVRKILDILDEREKEVLKLYFGVGVETSHTLDEIGTQLNLSRERVRQIKEKAMHRLKHSYLRNRLKAFAE